MQSSGQAARLDDKKIAHVRALRRDAIRRRRVLVLSLAVVAIVVLVLALSLHFSPLFALIPVALDAAVLVLGARASRQAREWEHMVAKAKKAARGNKARQEAAVQQTPAMRAAQRLRNAEEGTAEKTPSAEDSATYAMSQQEIRRTIEQAREEKQAALEARERQRAAVEAANQKAREEVVARKRAEAERRRREAAQERKRREAAERQRAEAQAAAERERRARAAAEERRRQEAEAAKRPAQPTKPENSSRQQPKPSAQPVASPTKPAQQAAAKTQPKPVREPKPAEPDDYTTELTKVSPSHPLDAFELASNQDLISFSLGSPRHGNEVAVSEPQSREIKSTKQVAHAEPVKSGSEPARKDSQASAPSQGGKAKAAEPKPQAKARPKAGSSKPGDIWQSALARSVSRSKPRAQRPDHRDGASAAGNDAARKDDASAKRDASAKDDATVKDDAMEQLIDAKKVEERHAVQRRQRQTARREEKVSVPKASGESLGTDVDAVLARRRG
ncbi:hypothetical protein KIH77_08515 [Bifidobacterium sp. 82T24]|uniref:hypothetical protein n=1 Tax=Bifidobacterium pluvialisilvae TaxID=2834436 RepID=UPI001C58160A|nr:hypothetical protein [Bifidobacterium pluvialisilvae]MBW3088768.1 hypothetical protein [Bifidobacterium pluvialisilvae]